MPLVYQLNNHNSCCGAKPCYFGCGSESSREQMFLGAKVPGSESSVYGTFVPGSKSTWERKFHNSFSAFLPSQTRGKV